jgi:hypothetical protein
MKAGELNDWLGVITNIGVVAGLALVAFQIHQNNLALERDARVAQVEMVDGIRAAWQTWEYSIIENRDVAEIWMKGKAGEPLDRLEEFRFNQLAREMFRLISQNYRQYSTMRGESADEFVQQLVDTAEGSPRLKESFIYQLERGDNGVFSQNSLRLRVKELDPPELRRQ